MEAKKNLCGMIPEELHARAVAEKEQLGLKTLGEYVELILKEHFEGGGIRPLGSISPAACFFGGEPPCIFTPTI